jgi:hypothetical protein
MKFVVSLKINIVMKNLIFIFLAFVFMSCTVSNGFTSYIDDVYYSPSSHRAIVVEKTKTNIDIIDEPININDSVIYSDESVNLYYIDNVYDIDFSYRINRFYRSNYFYRPFYYLSWDYMYWDWYHMPYYSNYYSNYYFGWNVGWYNNWHYPYRYYDYSYINNNYWTGYYNIPSRNNYSRNFVSDNRRQNNTSVSYGSSTERRRSVNSNIITDKNKVGDNSRVYTRPASSYSQKRSGPYNQGNNNRTTNDISKREQTFNRSSSSDSKVNSMRRESTINNNRVATPSTNSRVVAPSTNYRSNTMTNTRTQPSTNYRPNTQINNSGVQPSMNRSSSPPSARPSVNNTSTPSRTNSSSGRR